MRRVGRRLFRQRKYHLKKATTYACLPQSVVGDLINQQASLYVHSALNQQLL